MMPQLSEPAVAVTGGSTATTMRASSGRAQRGGSASSQLALPQAGHALLDDLALELLAAERGVAVAALHLGQERRRQVGGVVGGARAAGDGGGVVHDALQQRDGARRGGDHALRRVAEPQRELQHVPGVARAGATCTSSSHQAASNCGPRRLSGSSAANICAMAPLGHTSWLLGASSFGRSSGGCTDSRPETPSIMTLRTWPMVSPTSAMRCERRVGERRRRRAPARAPTRRRRASCRSRGRRARARCARARRSASCGGGDADRRVPSPPSRPAGQSREPLWSEALPVGRHPAAGIKRARRSAISRLKRSASANSSASAAVAGWPPATRSRSACISFTCSMFLMMAPKARVSRS